MRDSSNSKWKTHMLKLRTRRCHCGAVAIDDHRMVITGGLQPTRIFSSVELFDCRATGGKAQRLSHMNVARNSHVSIVHGDYVYVIGGYNTRHGVRRDVERLNLKDITTSSWETVAIMQRARSCFAAVNDDKYIYVFGGTGLNKHVHMAEMYDVLNNKWKSIPPMKQGRRAHAAVKVRGKAYVLGGINSKDQYLASMEIFDTQSQKWEDHTNVDMPIALAYMKAVVVNDWIVVIGGCKNNCSALINRDELFIFDTNNKSWTRFNTVQMSFPRDDFAVSVLQHDTIFVVGGMNENEPRNMLGSIEYANINDLQVTETSGQSTNYEGRSNMPRIKEEEDGEVHYNSQPSIARGTVPDTNNQNSSPTYSLHERVMSLEKHVGQKENSHILKRRVDHLETNVFGKILIPGVSIVKRIKRLENETSEL